MNILCINSYDCSPASGGGVNRIVYVLSRYFMEQRGFNCFFGYYYDHPARPLAEFAGRIKLCKNFDAPAFESFISENKIDVIQINFLKKENLCTIPQIYQIAHKHNVKVLYCLHVCPGFETVTYGSWERVKFSITHHDHPMRELKRWMITATKPLLRPISDRLIRNKYLIPYQNCDRVVVLSQFYKEPYARIAGVKDLTKFDAIGNALTFKEYASEEDIANKKKEVLIVARFDEFSKRISLALKVWRKIEKDPRLNDWELTLVGSGEAENFYKYLVGKWQLKRVNFTGHQNPIEYYRRASIFLMTSSAEGWGMTITEAMQMGVPTIAFDSFGALYDMIQDEYNGYIVPNNNISAFSQKLTELMMNDTIRRGMCINAVNSSKTFEIEKVAKKWIKIFDKLAASRK